jgi:predicted nucleotide-binding protein
VKEIERLYRVFASYAGKTFFPQDWDGFISRTRLYSVQGDTTFTSARDVPLEDGARSAPLSYRFIANHFDKLGSTDRDRLEMLEVGTPKLMEWALFEVEGHDRQDFCRFLEANWDIIPENWQEGAKQSDEADRFPSAPTETPEGPNAVPFPKIATPSRPSKNLKGKSTPVNQAEVQTKPVFIIHGHDDGRKKEMYHFLHDITGIPPFILHEQGSASDTVIEKLERVAKDAGFAVALLTADDFGRSVKEPAASDRLRGRQNVVFEAGYFMALLGRKNVLLVKEADVEDIGDLKGVVYTDYQLANWKSTIAQELDDAGYEIRWKRVNP